jgi:hypothetical protein
MYICIRLLLMLDENDERDNIDDDDLSFLLLLSLYVVMNFGGPLVHKPTN